MVVIQRPLEVLRKTRGKISKNPSPDGCTYGDSEPQLFPRTHLCTLGINYGGTTKEMEEPFFVVVFLRPRMRAAC